MLNSAVQSHPAYKRITEDLNPSSLDPKSMLSNTRLYCLRYCYLPPRIVKKIKYKKIATHSGICL